VENRHIAFWHARGAAATRRRGHAEVDDVTTIARANGWMAEQGVKNPVRLAYLIVPGFGSWATALR
jgi:hypothetical protein